MIIVLPLKQTKPVDFTQPFENYINKTYQDPRLYEQIKPVLEKINNLRTSMQFDKVTLGTINDIKNQEELEQKIISYIRYLSLLKKRFKSEHSDPSSIQTTFFWTSSNSPTMAAQSNSINYELAAMYYNLAVVEYYSGTLKSMRGEEQDKKFAISRFRNGVWAINQCQALVQSLPNPILANNIDFSKSNLETLEHLLKGLANKSMYVGLQANEKQLGLNVTASILFESVKQFELAQKSWVQFCYEAAKKVPQALLDNTRQVIQFNYVWSLTQACLKMATFHYAKVKDETRGQNMGKALGFLVKADSVLAPILSDKNVGKNYPAVMVDQFRVLKNDLQILQTDYSTRNAQIYKEQIVNEQMLPYPVVPDNLIIKPLVPPVMNEAHEDEGLFSGFVSEEAMQLAKDISEFVDKKRYELEETLKLLNDQKNKAYEENYVNALLDIAHGQGIQQTQQLPATILTKVQNIRNKGCLQGAQRLIDQSKSQAGICSQQLGVIKANIDKEAQQDQQMRLQYGQQSKWKPSDQLNQELITCWNDLSSKLQQARQVDLDIFGYFQQSQQYIQLAEQPDSVIAQQIPQSNKNDEFLNQNKDAFDQLSQTDLLVNQEIDGMKQCIFKFSEVCALTNFTQSAILGIQQGNEKSIVFQNVIQNSLPIIDQFNQGMNSVQGQVSSVLGQATKLSSLRKSVIGTSSLSNTFSQGFQQANEFFENIDFGIAFYQQLIIHLTDLEKKVNDYVYSREIERQEILKSIKTPGPQQPNVNQFQPQAFPQQYPSNQYPQQQQYTQQNQPQNYQQPSQYSQQPQSGYQQPYQVYNQQQYPGQQQYPPYQQYPAQPGQYPGQISSLYPPSQQYPQQPPPPYNYQAWPKK